MSYVYTYSFDSFIALSGARFVGFWRERRVKKNCFAI